MEVHNPQTKKVLERLRVTTEANVIPIIHDATEEGHQHYAACRDEPFDVRCRLVCQQVKARREYEAISGEVGGRMRKVDHHIRVIQWAVERLDLVDLTDCARGVVRQLESPPRPPVEDASNL